MTPEEQIAELNNTVTILSKKLEGLNTVQEALNQSEEELSKLKSANEALTKEIVDVKALNLLLAGRNDVGKTPIEQQLDNLFGQRKEG